VFIYEGDNDLFAGVSPRKIKRITKKIIRAIQKNNKQTQIVLIAAKPSISRWDLRTKYEQLNGLFERLAAKKELLIYADVWNPMLKEGALDKSLFISDGLHMNQKGYDIWESVLKPLILK
jgi:lysophospholipase L1-like esterase